MGASGSRLSVRVEIDKPSYYTGEVVTGSLWVRTNQTVAYRDVNVEMIGEEKTKWLNSNAHGNLTVYRVKHEFFHRSQPILDKGTGQPVDKPGGSHQWRFSFALPEDISGSCEFKGIAEASIRYHVQADGALPEWSESRVHDTMKVQVLPRWLELPRSLHLESEAHIYMLGRIHKGMVRLRANIDSNVYAPGDAIKIRAEIENHSSVEVTGVMVKVLQFTRLLVDDKITEYDHYKGDFKSFEDLRAYHLMTRTGKPAVAIAAPGAVSKYEATLVLPKKLQPTCCDSKLIKLTYVIQICAHMGLWHSDVLATEVIVIRGAEKKDCHVQRTPQKL